jgi:hypothetical protein
MVLSSWRMSTHWLVLTKISGLHWEKKYEKREEKAEKEEKRKVKGKF